MRIGVIDRSHGPMQSLALVRGQCVEQRVIGGDGFQHFECGAQAAREGGIGRIHGDR
jgi:hypothetical protein